MQRIVIGGLLLWGLALCGCVETVGRLSHGDGFVSSQDAGTQDGVGLPAADGPGLENDATAGLPPDTGCPGGFGGPPSNADPPLSGSWTLTFQDDFIGEVVDDTKWKVGQHWAGINGIAANEPANISQQCGYLSITAQKRSVTFAGKDYSYVSGELSSYKRFRQRYGYFEARIRFDGICGLWPAFWLMPDRGEYGSGENTRISYLKFDLKNDSRSSVTKAVLKLHVDSAATGGQNLVLFRVPDDEWSESSLTWNNRPSPDPLWIEMKYDPQLSTGETVSFDITDLVNQQLAGDRVISLALADGFNKGARISFSSKEGGNPPLLELSGDPAALTVSEDAWVGRGSLADQNQGAEPQLDVEEDWTSSTSTYDGGMEFDIMESLGIWGPHMTSHALHWDGYGDEHQNKGAGHQELSPTEDGFHVYGLNWQPGLVEFYVDGNKTFEWNDSRVASVEEFIILSLQMGGWQDNYGDNRNPDDAALPGEMVVDYVRVWSGSP